MKFKKGDKIRIRPDLENLMFDMPEIFSDVCKYAGRIATILNVVKDHEYDAYILDVDSGRFLWADKYFMDIYDDANNVSSTLNKNYPMSPADALREISMMVETMQLKEFDIQCTDGVINFTMARNVEE